MATWPEDQRPYILAQLEQRAIREQDLEILRELRAYRRSLENPT
jgi:hypothetical protein